MAGNKRKMAADEYQADILELIERAEKNLNREEYADLLQHVSNECDGKYDTVVNELRSAGAEEIAEY